LGLSGRYFFAAAGDGAGAPFSSLLISFRSVLKAPWKRSAQIPHSPNPLSQSGERAERKEKTGRGRGEKTFFLRFVLEKVPPLTEGEEGESGAEGLVILPTRA